VYYPRNWYIQRHHCQNLQPRNSYIFCALGGIGVTCSWHTVPKWAAVNTHRPASVTTGNLCSVFSSIQVAMWQHTVSLLVRTATLAYCHVTLTPTFRMHNILIRDSQASFPSAVHLPVTYTDSFIWRNFLRLATGWRIRGSNACMHKRFISFPKCPDRLWGPPSLYSVGTTALYPGVKRPEREAGPLRT